VLIKNIKAIVITINLNFDSKEWKILDRKIESNLKLITKKILVFIFRKKKVQISILLTSSSKMKLLNQKFRSIKKDTDVLSFPFYYKNNLNLKSKKSLLYIGDLALSYGYIWKKVKKNKKEFIVYTKKMLVHGILHLIGFSHNTYKQFNKMHFLEKKILNKI